MSQGHSRTSSNMTSDPRVTNSPFTGSSKPSAPLLQCFPCRIYSKDTEPIAMNQAYKFEFQKGKSGEIGNFMIVHGDDNGCDRHNHRIGLYSANNQIVGHSEITVFTAEGPSTCQVQNLPGETQQTFLSLAEKLGTITKIYKGTEWGWSNDSFIPLYTGLDFHMPDFDEVERKYEEWRQKEIDMFKGFH